ncbi:MAG: hypothetical protein RQ756_09345 [Flavobacteriaceae bacterium]|nr:hypothetical protein [Flavobacteriaceae bacterium]
MIPIQTLKDLGFTKSYGETLDNGDYYIVYSLSEGDFKLDCTNTHLKTTRNLYHQFFEINGTTLNGTITEKRLKTLIKTLFKC